MENDMIEDNLQSLYLKEYRSSSDNEISNFEFDIIG